MLKWFRKKWYDWFSAKSFLEGTMLAQFVGLIDSYTCLEYLRQGETDKVIESLEDTIDHLVVSMSHTMPKVSRSTKDLAVELLKRTYEYRKKFADSPRPHTPCLDAELEKHHIEAKAKAEKYLQHVWDNEPGNPIYRRKSKK